MKLKSLNKIETINREELVFVNGGTCRGPGYNTCNQDTRKDDVRDTKKADECKKTINN
jgi:hypothetical protein